MKQRLKQGLRQRPAQGDKGKGTLHQSGFSEYLNNPLYRHSVWLAQRVNDLANLINLDT